MSLRSPSVTVIIPTYNRAHLLGRSIKSVLGQTYRDIELIVVDDCSTDNTEEVIRSFSDERLRSIRLNKNSGSPAVPTNKGIEAARGEYIAIQDSDDEWLPGKLEKQMNVFKKVSPEVAIVYTDVWRIRENGEKEYLPSPHIMPEDGIIYREALGYRVEGIGTQTLLIRKECFSKTGLFDEKLRMFIDTELLIRVSKYYYFYHLQEPLVNYFDTPGSLAHDSESWIPARILILEEFFDDIRKSRRLLATHYFSIGHHLCLRGEFAQGRNYLIKSSLAYHLNIKFLMLAFMSLIGRVGYRIISTLLGVPRTLDVSPFFKWNMDQGLKKRNSFGSNEHAKEN